MSTPPKAPPVYKPNLPKVAAPPVYRPEAGKKSAQPKRLDSRGMEKRPAPPVYRPGQSQGVQQKTANSLTLRSSPTPAAYPLCGRGSMQLQSALSLQRRQAGGNWIANRPAFRSNSVVQRMLVAYTYLDHGRSDPNQATDWLAQSIASCNYQRSSMTTAVKHAVDAFADGKNDGEYKHHVPSERIWRAIENLITGRLKTRERIIQFFKLKLEHMGINDDSNLDPRLNVPAFNAWLSWAVDYICDWPDNIYRWPSAGDGRGTQIDVPNGDAPAALTNRLTDAANTLNQELGVPLAARVTFA